MNPRSWITALSLAMSALIAGLAFWQHSNLASLRSQLSKSRIQSSPEITPIPKALSEGSLSESEKLELARLRAEVTRLHQRHRELAGEEIENKQLRAAALASQHNTSPSSIPLPSGYVRRRDAQFAGMANPESSVQSFFWAIEHRDTNVLMQVVDDTTSAGFRKQLASKGIEDFWKELSVVPGYRLIESQVLPDNSVKLKIEFMPNDEAQSFVAHQTAEGWRLRL